MSTTEAKLKVTRDPVPMKLWGKDHWSTLAYLECRVVDQKGVLDTNQMRCNEKRHPQFSHTMGRMSGSDGSEYATRLKPVNGMSVELEDHDDWDCVDDFVGAGLVAEFPDSDGKVKLTPKGWAVAGALRQHKGSGGNFADFNPEEDERE